MDVGVCHPADLPKCRPLTTGIVEWLLFLTELKSQIHAWLAGSSAAERARARLVEQIGAGVRTIYGQHTEK